MLLIESFVNWIVSRDYVYLWNLGTAMKSPGKLNRNGNPYPHQAGCIF